MKSLAPILSLILLTSCTSTKLSKEAVTNQEQAKQTNSITLDKEATKGISDSLITASAHKQRHSSIKKESTGN